MHLRRGLLLFAIVLAVAAVAASFAPRDEGGGPDNAPTVSGQAPTPEAAAKTELARFSTAGKPARRKVDVRRQVQVIVTSREPGGVELADLGQTAQVDPDTPATFDLFLTRPGTHAVEFTPALGTPRRVGTLVVGSGSR